MLQELGTEIFHLVVELLEGFLMALIGAPTPKRRRRTARRIARPRRINSVQYQNRIVLSERAWLRMSHELVQALPRDEAISVLNTIKHYAANV